MSKFPLSYSRVATFKKCPAQFEALYVDKSVVDHGNDATRYGNRVHEQLERYGTTGNIVGLTNESVKWRNLVDKLRAYKGDKYYEYKMAIDEACKPCDWFADEVWFRGIADVLIVNGDKAYCADWKTGKSRYEDVAQLRVFVCLIMFHFPEVKQVRADFFWLVEDRHTKMVFDRMHLTQIWENLVKQFDIVQEAVDLGVFVAKPSRLCNWCAAKDTCIYK